MSRSGHRRGKWRSTDEIAICAPNASHGAVTYATALLSNAGNATDSAGRPVRHSGTFSSFVAKCWRGPTGLFNAAIFTVVHRFH